MNKYERKGYGTLLYLLNECRICQMFRSFRIRGEFAQEIRVSEHLSETSTLANILVS